MTSNADLYLDEINLERYFAKDTCKKCGANSCKDLIEKLKEKSCSIAEFTETKSNAAQALQTIMNMEGDLPKVPVQHLPRSAPPGLTELNNPSDGDPILVTGNNLFTQEVLMFVLASTCKPFYFLSADTHGDPIDMAVILRSFTPEAIQRALDAEEMARKAPSSPLVIPGRTHHLAEAIATETKRQITIGPVCAVELPLFYGDTW